MNDAEKYRKWFVLGMTLGFMFCAWGFLFRTPATITSWYGISMFVSAFLFPAFFLLGLGKDGYVTVHGLKPVLVMGENPIPCMGFPIGILVSTLVGFIAVFLTAIAQYAT